jgi:hypothetical protein
MNGSRSRRQPLHVRAEHDRRKELARVLGPLWRGLQPALRAGEAGGEQAPLGLARAGVVPRRSPAEEVLGVGTTRENRLGVPAQHVDVALSPALRDELPARAQRGVQAREQAIVIGDPVKRRRRQDRVDRLLQLDLQQVSHAHVDARQTLACGVDHRLRGVYGDRTPTRQALDQQLRDPPRAAAGVEHGLVAAQLQPLQHLASERLHRPGDAVIAAAVPFSRLRHTSVRYHVCPVRARRRPRPLGSSRYLRYTSARAASSAITRESCPPCQAIGERAGGPACSTTRCAAGISCA